jgi:ABC-type histidine transport system ATPase subunit
MDQGEIVEEGTPDQLLTQPSSERLRSLLGLIAH